MAYSQETWAELKAAYASGQFASIYALFSEYSKKLEEKCPSFKQITMRATTEKWPKASRKAELEEVQHEKFRRIAAEQGFDDVKLMKAILDMCNDDDKSIRNQGLQRYFDVTGVKAPHKIAKTDSTGDDVPDTVVLIERNGFEPTGR